MGSVQITGLILRRLRTFAWPCKQTWNFCWQCTKWRTAHFLFYLKLNRVHKMNVCLEEEMDRVSRVQLLDSEE